MKIAKNFSLAIFGVFALFSLFVSLVSPAFAAATDPAHTGLDNVVNGNSKLTILKSGPLGNPESGTAALIGTILSYVGIAFLLLMIYGGILWMVSRGNEKQVETARGIIINAVIGLIIVIFAYAVTSYVGRSLSGSTPSGNSSSPAPTTQPQ